MMRIGFGIKCWPFCLACVTKSHIKKFEKSNFEAFQMSNALSCMDDLCKGSKTIQEAFNLFVRL